MKSDLSMTAGASRPSDQIPISASLSDHQYSSGRNVVGLLAQREISPRAKHVTRRRWGGTSKRKSVSSFGPKSELTRDAKRGLLSWVEAESLQHLSANYCELMPPPRSTIAAAYSLDGRTLASTHGDHTVKIIDCQSGSCLKVLRGHRRTPWVVRFHPLHPEIIASGSLDNEVRLWDLNTSDCIGSRGFSRPIASIAFHAKGELLAVASGHKLYIWNYKGEVSTPDIVLKTRRTLRAVHFHPQAAPLLLTAEVNDLDSSESSMTRATSPGDLQYQSPAIFVANVHSSELLTLAAELPLTALPFVFVPPVIDEPRIESQRENGPAGTDNIQVTSSASMQFQANAAEQKSFSSVPTITHPNAEEHAENSFLNGTGSGNHTEDGMETDEIQAIGESQHRRFTDSSSDRVPANSSSHIDSSELGQPHSSFPYRDPAFWELPALQGWLTGRSQASFPSMHPLNRGGINNISHHIGFSSTSLSVDSGRSGFQHSYGSGQEYGHHDAFLDTLHDWNDAQPIISRIQSGIATCLAAPAAADLPGTVKLRIWSHDIKDPCAPLNSERCRLTIPHAVLCSEMGTHFSSCGRFLAACVACMLPHTEADLGLQSLVHQDSGFATSPTRHPISAHQIMYELRIYSLEEATFGSILVSRAIRAAHCLTSIQFSPTSEHILLAYGRRHGSLLKSIVIDEDTTLPIYTVLEVYRVSDMELVRVLPSAEDEVNVACFHPFSGGGLAYGTKEGKLRVLRFDGRGETSVGPNYFTEVN